MLNWKVKNAKSQVQLAQLIDQRFRFITLNWQSRRVSRCLALNQQYIFGSMIKYNSWQHPCTEAQRRNTKNVVIPNLLSCSSDERFRR